MASPPLLDFDALIAPIPGDEPAGMPAPLTTRQKLETLRKDFEPHPDDPSQPPVAKKPDWEQIRRLTLEVLTRTSKDLETSLRLTEALLKLHGLAGLRDGLRMVRELATHCWDRLHPMPDEGEGMEARAERFYWITDPDKGARLPNSVRQAPLVKVTQAASADRRAQVTELSFQDAQAAMRGQGDVPASALDSAEPRDANVAEDLDQCLEELNQLEQVLTEKCDKEAPAWTGLRAAIDDCRKFLQTVARRKQPAGTESPNGAGGEHAAVSAGALMPATSREEAYRQLAQIANNLERLEPHSPIPDLLRRAIELGKMPFRQLIQELVREPHLLSEVRREFGLKGADADAEAPASE